MGWGGSGGTELGWGALEWGTGDTLQLLSAEAIRENVVRLTFTVPIKFTKILDPNDASDPEHYTIAAVAGSMGLDSKPVRNVAIASVELFTPNIVDVTLDRPMSPYPCQYTIAASGIVALETGEALDPGTASITFFAVYRGIPPNTPSAAVPRRDIANPSLASSAISGEVTTDAQLGVFVVDETGDYAADQGITSWRKRVFRRILSEENGFAHLPGYGVGLLSQVKQLGRPAIQGSIAAKAEDQIRQEPETVSVSVTFEQDDRALNLFRMRVQAKSNTGEEVNDVLTSFDPLQGG